MVGVHHFFLDSPAEAALRGGDTPLLGWATMTKGLAPRTYTIEEVAQILGTGRNSTYQAAKRGDLPVIRIGRRLLVPRAALDKLLSGEAA
jgi:excisionase family DNA binding protein